jgi:hypothetical protein
MVAINYFHIIVGIAFIYMSTMVKSQPQTLETTLKVLGSILIVVHAYFAYNKLK